MTQIAGFTDIDSTLRKDDKGTFVEKIISSLDTYYTKIKQEIQKGVPPNQYDDLLKEQQAIKSACEGLNQLWALYHKKS